MGQSQPRSCFRRTYKLPIAILVALGTFLACGNAGFSQTSASDMESLATLTPDVNSRMVSPENPTGQKGKGAMATPNPADPDLSFSIAASDLGKGWKVRPFIKVAAHSTVTIMDVDGPGTIEHIWMASSADFRGVGRAINTILTSK